VPSLRRKSTPPASQWPEWTDADRWELGPDPADARWAAENLNDDYDHDGPVPDEVLDQLASVAAAQDRLERGLLL
jgi:hypothetical protein